jgi:hypothetical protein
MASRRIETGDGWKTGRPTPRGRHGRALSGLEVTLLGHASPSCSEHLVGLGPTSVSLPEVEMWNGGAAASIVPPTIYLPAGSGVHIPTAFHCAASEPGPAGRRAAHLRSEAGRVRLQRDDPTQRNDRLLLPLGQQHQKWPCDLRFWSPRRDSNPRPSDYETDARRRPGRLQTDRACSRWMPRRSRRIQKDRLDDQTDDQGLSDRIGCQGKQVSPRTHG